MSSELFRRIAHQLMRRHKPEGHHKVFFPSNAMLAAPLHQFHIRLDVFPDQRLDQHELFISRIDLLQKGQVVFPHAQYFGHITSGAVKHLIVIIVPATFAIDNVGCQTIKAALDQILQHRMIQILF